MFVGVLADCGDTVAGAVGPVAVAVAGGMNGDGAATVAADGVGDGEPLAGGDCADESTELFFAVPFVKASDLRFADSRGVWRYRDFRRISRR